ncbi:hypothetical protein [Streptomyces sp. ID05-39B]|uniref:MmyB family transcriptional regulator n=1 Tax=Streptomyces sp. ID05-39B TaxID=3028664 RepID=UPI0034DB0B51
MSRRDRDVVRRAFLQQPDGRRLYSVSDADEFTRTAAQHLRAAAARYPGDPELTDLIAELLDGSEEFARLWAAHEAAARPTPCKTFGHPLMGPVSVNCDVLDITDRDQRVVICTATPAPRRSRHSHCCPSTAPSGWTSPAEGLGPRQSDGVSEKGFLRPDRCGILRPCRRS